MPTSLLSLPFKATAQQCFEFARLILDVRRFRTRSYGTFGAGSGGGEEGSTLPRVAAND